MVTYCCVCSKVITGTIHYLQSYRKIFCPNYFLWASINIRAFPNSKGNLRVKKGVTWRRISQIQLSSLGEHLKWRQIDLELEKPELEIILVSFFMNQKEYNNTNFKSNITGNTLALWTFLIFLPINIYLKM